MKRLVWHLVGLLLWGLHLLSVELISNQPRVHVPAETAVYLPPLAQLFMAAGDRFLVANINVIRTSIEGTHELKPETYWVLAGLHRDAAFFNPGHEDNYYLASATLPGNGQLDTAQQVLTAAMSVRRRDIWPPFFYGFHQLYYLQDPVLAAESLMDAASNMPDPNHQLALRQLAMQWYERGDLHLAARLLRLSAKRNRDPIARSIMLQRVQRIDNLVRLRELAEQYRLKFGQPLQRVEQLLDAQLIERIPDDPLGGQYHIGKRGLLIVVGGK